MLWFLKSNNQQFMVNFIFKCTTNIIFFLIFKVLINQFSWKKIMLRCLKSNNQQFMVNFIFKCTTNIIFFLTFKVLINQFSWKKIMLRFLKSNNQQFMVNFIFKPMSNVIFFLQFLSLDLHTGTDTVSQIIHLTVKMLTYVWAGIFPFKILNTFCTSWWCTENWKSKKLTLQTVEFFFAFLLKFVQVKIHLYWNGVYKNIQLCWLYCSHLK